MSLHAAATLYVAADSHKNGDFTPYIFESTDPSRPANWLEPISA
jgi:hypothetical protein